jgi:hypothetical protein
MASPIRALRESPGEFAAYAALIATLAAGAAALGWWTIPLATTAITLLRWNALRRRAKEVHQEWGRRSRIPAYATVVVFGLLLHLLIAALAFAAGRSVAMLI